MKLDSYVQYIPTIEDYLRRFRLDALVCGLGPTAWLLPWVDQKLLAGVRLWGCHDGCRIMPMDDLVVMDSPHQPHGRLNPDSGRFKHIVDARPKRLWLFKGNAPHWKPYLAPSMASVTQEVEWAVAHPKNCPPNFRKVKFKLVGSPLIHTTTISPTGMTTLAWREGCRRIGVIGVEMMRSYHHTWVHAPLVDHFFGCVTKEAAELGGLIVNLSPISALEGFKAWTLSAFTSDPTTGSAQPAPSESSNTASESMPPAMSS